MRILAIERTPSQLRVAYRWLGDLLTPPRLLIDGPLTALSDLRTLLETDIFGEPLGADDYQLLINDPAFEAETRAIFPGMLIAVHDGLSAESLIATATTQGYRDLCALFADRLADYAIDPDAAHADLSALRDRETVHIVGYSRTATATAAALIAQTDLTPVILTPESTFGPADWGIIAVSGDPGPSRRESAIAANDSAFILIVFDPADPAPPEPITRFIHDVLGGGLSDWLTAHFELDDGVGTIDAARGLVTALNVRRST